MKYRTARSLWVLPLTVMGFASILVSLIHCGFIPVMQFKFIAILWALVILSILLIPLTWHLRSHVRSAYIKDRRCLRCDQPGVLVQQEDGGWFCRECGAMFTMSGYSIGRHGPDPNS
jgi:hypothetical protein